MTPEQKQQRIKQIEARQLRRHRSDPPTLSIERQDLEDIDFLLSLVKSQEAGDVSEHIDMETPARIVKRWLLEARNGRALESVLLERDRELLERYIAQIATSMRSAYVEKVKAMRGEWLSKVSEEWDDRPDLSFDAAERVAAADKIINELESLSIEKPKE